MTTLAIILARAGSQGLAGKHMRPLAAMPLTSVITSPAEGGRTAVGPQEIVGVAFSGEAPVGQVEVSVDGGKSWSRAKLEGEAGVGRWQVFRHRFEQRKPGVVTAVARAKDRRGQGQPEKAAWNPSGYVWNGWHAVSWEVVGS